MNRFIPETTKIDLLVHCISKLLLFQVIVYMYDILLHLSNNLLVSSKLC